MNFYRNPSANPRAGRVSVTAGAACGALLAAPYVRPQTWAQPLPPSEALKTGTVFAALNLPFVGKEVMGR